MRPPLSSSKRLSPHPDAAKASLERKVKGTGTQTTLVVGVSNTKPLITRSSCGNNTMCELLLNVYLGINALLVPSLLYTKRLARGLFVHRFVFTSDVALSWAI